MKNFITSLKIIQSTVIINFKNQYINDLNKNRKLFSFFLIIIRNE